VLVLRFAELLDWELSRAVASTGDNLYRFRVESNLNDNVRYFFPMFRRVENNKAL
jgi:hypothetical protein